MLVGSIGVQGQRVEKMEQKSTEQKRPGSLVDSRLMCDWSRRRAVVFRWQSSVSCQGFRWPTAALAACGGGSKDITTCQVVVGRKLLAQSTLSTSGHIVFKTRRFVLMQVSKLKEFLCLFMVVPLSRILTQLLQITLKPKAEEAIEQQYNYC